MDNQAFLRRMKANLFPGLIFWMLVTATERTEGACSMTEFQCTDEVHCIEKTWVCDGQRDCPDGSDEGSVICSGRKVCPELQKQCKNGRCLPKLWLCDGRDDCGDNTDESEEFCANRQCTKDEFRCKEPDNRCLNKRTRCDGRLDCRDGSDEHGCVRATCSPVEFECNHGGCISLKWACDGEEDCYDGSDEADCGPKNCSTDHFQCTNRKCTLLEWVCDGHDDCGDMSDEIKCPMGNRNLTCEETEFNCSDGSNCVQLAWRCDGFPDCRDASDEQSCVEECQDDQLKCHTGECIGLAHECDGKLDCPDGSDEHVLCRELPLEHTSCNSSTEFDCGGHHCISLEAVCNGKDDCGDNKDEGEGCNKDECLIENGGCHDICIDLKIGFRCGCSKPGFKLGADNRSCHDIDECLEIPGSCSQFCNNTMGSFTCSCSPGYILEPNNRVCRAGGDNALLIFSDRHDIRMINLVNKDYHDILSVPRPISAIDYKLKGGIVVWSDGNEGGILKATLNSNVTTSIAARRNYGNIAGIAVDWIHDNIYWADTVRDEICVAELSEGRHMKTLFATHLKEARAIAVDPQTGSMFWADWRLSKIEKAGMDGTNRRTFIDTDIKWPNGLAIDRHDKKLYWIDTKLHLIACCDLNGGNRKTIIASHESFGHPYDIDVFEDSIYWSDWHMRRIFSAHKVTGDNLTVVTKAPSPMSLAVIHALKQPAYPNRCANHACAHLCLPSPTDLDESVDHRCLCENGFRLAKDGLRCERLRPKSTSKPANDFGTKDPDGTVIAAIVICSLSIIAFPIVVALYFAFRRFQHYRHVRAANLENPIYLRTFEELFPFDEPGPSTVDLPCPPGAEKYI